MSNSNANINSYMEVNPVIRDQSRAYFYKCRMLVDRSKGLCEWLWDFTPFCMFRLLVDDWMFLRVCRRALLCSVGNQVLVPQCKEDGLLGVLVNWTSI